MDPAANRPVDPLGRVILALDTDSLAQACEWVERFRGHLSLFKVGSQLFTREGPNAVEDIKQRGGEVFLDLKYHDIPNTVQKAAVAATALGVKFLDIHALGGGDMIRTAVAAVNQEAARLGVASPAVLAVTILTSLDDQALAALGLKGDVETCVIRLAEMAISAGAQGLVASPQEIRPIREKLGKGILLVTPGIRPLGTNRNDQKRVMGPKEALAAGADYLVMGRSLLQSPDPMGILRDLEK